MKHDDPVYAAALVELEAWHEVVAVLKVSGAVKEADCKAGENDLPLTFGTNLFRVLRAWGKAVGDLRVEAFKREGDATEKREG